SSSRTKGIADLEREMEELRASYQQVCEERDALEDLLLQEQLKNRTPADKQLEEAKAHAAALELELRSMAARCEEWKRRAAQRAAEMNPAMVQALLEERLEDLDESGTIKIQMEVARLRDELAKSEVLRFELFRSTQEGAALPLPSRPPISTSDEQQVGGGGGGAEAADGGSGCRQGDQQ
ncbi:unnamed protein product, partial [Closterium sp. NIES-53]